jgi:hypothetical protein
VGWIANDYPLFAFFGPGQWCFSDHGGGKAGTAFRAILCDEWSKRASAFIQSAAAGKCAFLPVDCTSIVVAP